MYRYAEIILFPLQCGGPKGHHKFQKVLTDLKGLDGIACPVCGASVDLSEHKRAIEHFLDTAAQLDILARRRQ